MAFLPARSLVLWAALSPLACGSSAPPPSPGAPPETPTPSAALSFRGDVLAATVDERFLSFAIDTAQVVGGEFWGPEGQGGNGGMQAAPRFDFTRPRLRPLAAALSPAYLRIGGTDADRTVYNLADGPAPPPPNGARWVLTRQQWDAVCGFARSLGLRLLFTLNAGPGARDGAGAWQPDDARELIAHSVSRGCPVDIWELGNELNGFPVAHGLWITPEQYAADLARARLLVDQLAPQARLAGPATAYWPVVGPWRPFHAEAVERAGKLLDVVTWHYYPQQSGRCPVATRRAERGRMLSPGELGDIDRWASEVEAGAKTHAPGAAVWLGETGSAQCGGEPGFSDTFADALWWLDTLGRIARRGQAVVVRQTLAGSDYGLIDDRTLEPNPSYWASWLWRNLMGPRVLAPRVEPDAPTLRVYVHCNRPDRAEAPGGVSVLFVHLGEKPTAISLPMATTRGARVYRLTAPALDARRADLNGAELRTAPDGTPPALAQRGEDLTGGVVALPPTSLTFVALPAANASACR